MGITSVKPSILLGVTVADSWILLDGLPQRLVADGWNVHLVSNPGPRLGAYAGVEGIHIHPIPMEREISPLRDLRSLREWLTLTRNIKPDVGSVGPPKASLMGVISATLASKAKRVYHLRGLRLETARGLQKTILWMVERLTMSLAHTVLAVSESLRKEVIQDHLVPSRKVIVLGPGSSNGVDLARFSPSASLSSPAEEEIHSLELTPNIPVLGFVGRLTTDKGVEVLFDALRQLDEEGCSYQLLVVGAREGSGSDAFAGTSLGSRIHFTGPLSDVAPVFRRMDVLILPTLREGFPNVCLEAQASGKPVITTTATGAIDSVEDDVTGLLVPPADAPALAGAIRRVLSGEKTFSERDILAFAARFDRQLIQQLNAAFYRELVDPALSNKAPQ